MPTHDHGRPRPIASLFGPVSAPHGSPERRLLLARSVLVYLGTFLALVQVVVWLVIGLLTDGLDTPWWLWTTVPTIVGVVGLSLGVHWHTWWTAQTSQQEEVR